MEYKCSICNKNYSSYQSLWKHKKIYHTKTFSITTDKQRKTKINDKIKCDKCTFSCNLIDELKKHNQEECRPSVNSKNFYQFEACTLGKNKYKGFSGGDIYIVQTEFQLKGYYKIGITTNLYHRMTHYKCGAVLDPKLHFYYPCKKIKEADVLLKSKLKKYNVKREIYKCDNLDEIRNILKEVQKEMKSSVLEIVPEIKECEIMPCKSCDLHFTNNIDLKQHMIEKHNQIDLFIDDNKLKCNFCNNVYKHCSSKSKHEKKCKLLHNINVDYKKDNENLKNLIKKLEDENKQLKNELNIIKTMINERLLKTLEI